MEWEDDLMLFDDGDGWGGPLSADEAIVVRRIGHRVRWWSAIHRVLGSGFRRDLFARFSHAVALLTLARTETRDRVSDLPADVDLAPIVSQLVGDLVNAPHAPTRCRVALVAA